MDTRSKLRKYVGSHDNMDAAARWLGVPYSTLACVLNGTRGVGRSLAKRLSTGSQGRLKENELLLIAAHKTKVRATCATN